jgi:hypothetical protein
MMIQATMYARISDPAPRIVATAMTRRMSPASTPVYSARPPQTPPIQRSSSLR